MHIPRKGLFENNRCECFESPPNITCPNNDAIGQFFKHCGALAFRVSERHIEGLASEATTRNFIVGLKGTILPVNPLAILTPRDLKNRATKPLVSHGEVEVLDKRSSLTNSEMKLPKGLGKNELVNVVNNGWTKQIDAFRNLETSKMLVKECLPPRIQKGVPVSASWQFPPSRGRLNHFSSVKSGILVCGKSDVEPKSVLEMMRPVGMQTRNEIKTGYAQESKLDENASKENVDKVQNILGNLETFSRPLTSPKEYLPPRIRKGVHVFRQFPPGCGRQDHTSSSNSEVLANGRFGVDQNPLLDTMRTVHKQ